MECIWLTMADLLNPTNSSCFFMMELLEFKYNCPGEHKNKTENLSV
jgi:hypothetical protein